MKTDAHHSPSALTRVLNLFSSVWFGIVLLTLIFLYSSIGSAVPTVRQSRALELTEFEWFHWWPFDVLIGLFVVNLIVVTLRRIPLKVVNLGVWMIHTGIIVLCAGSVIYFGTKLEGDVPVLRRRVVIDVPGSDVPLSMPALPGNAVQAEGLGGTYAFRIVQIQPNWPLRSAPHDGELAYSVSVSVRTPTQEFVRQVLAGYPQYTEDILPGQGRAIKAVGKKIVDDAVGVRLEYEAQDAFFLLDTAAVYVRPAGTTPWQQRRLDGLPHYHERISDHDLVWGSREMGLTRDALDLEAQAVEPLPQLDDVEIRVTDYLRYATLQSRWVDGGTTLNPVVDLTVDLPGGTTHRFELSAFDAAAAQAPVAFKWLAAGDDVAATVAAEGARLHLAVPEHDIQLDVAVPDHPDPDAPFVPIADTIYSYRVGSRVDRLPLRDGRVVSVVLVEVKTPDRQFTRMVADDPRSTHDMGSSAAEGHAPAASDTGITMTYHPGRSDAPLTLVAGEAIEGLHVVWEGQQRHAQVGQSLDLGNGMRVTVNTLSTHARSVQRPWIVPLAQRDRDISKSLSMVRAVVSTAAGTVAVWLPYHHYVFPSEQYRSGFLRHEPTAVRLPDGRTIELVYSRRRHALPAAVALEDFELQTHAGGLIGRNSNVRDYRSELRFREPDGTWSAPHTMRLNHPAEHDGMWFFQSFWDAPDRQSAGMNYTGLGVGNRNGVMVQLLGTVIAVLGMCYAFYVKPYILRRRREQVYGALAESAAAGSAVPAPADAAVHTGSSTAP